MGEQIIKNEPFPYILIDDFYDQSELDGIWEELDYLCNPKRMGRSSMERGAATNVSSDGTRESIKNAWDIFLDTFFTSRDSSSILEINRKLFRDHEMFKNHPHWLFNHLDALNEDNTLIMYYENNDEYKPHRDLARLTGITWFYREPKKFTGGNLIFPRFDMEIECKHNRVILFPSSIYHGVEKVSMEEKDMGKKLGRFTMTQFLSCMDYQRL
tara:strand:- start:74 stop:712 length:639 start_codon:yes stop_codon:yes gene_type:complete